jgi:hypothetical protein
MKVTLNPAQRAGLLTQAAFLTTNANPDRTSIVMRGSLVNERFLCRDLMPPPSNVPDLPNPVPVMGTRENLERFVDNECTKGCHDIYPLGWAFENYDTIGRYREMEDGVPGKLINASGSVPQGKDMLRWKDAVDLAKQLPGLDEVRTCMAKQWFRYLFGRREAMGDEASFTAAGQSFAASSYDLRELIVAFTRTRAFTHRSPSDGEEVP